jgi:hypothetical protein
MLAHGFTTHRAFRLSYQWHMKEQNPKSTLVAMQSAWLALNTCDQLAQLDGLYLGVREND